MNTLTRILLPIVALTFPAAVLAEKLDQSWNVSADSTVTVSNVAGEIEFTTWDKNEVHLGGYLGKDLKLEVVESSHGVRIKVLNSDNDDYDESILQLVVPVGASVEASSVSADISIAGSRGASVSADSVSGDIDINAESDRIELSSVSGDIRFTGRASRASVETVSGDIELKGISGEISLSTVSGDAQLNAGIISQGKFETVSGSLEISLSVADGGRLTIDSMSGDIELYVPASQSAGFSAQTFSGDISSKFGKPKNDSFGSGSRLKHLSGDNGASIRLGSFSGDIRVGHK